MSAIIDRIRKAHSERRDALQAGTPWPLAKGDVAGHEFHGNQYGSQAAQHSAMADQHRAAAASAQAAGDTAKANAHTMAANAHNDAAAMYREGKGRQGQRFGHEANARSSKLGTTQAIIQDLSSSTGSAVSGGGKAKAGLTPGAVTPTASAGGGERNRGGV